MSAPGLLELATAEQANAKRHLHRLVPRYQGLAALLVVVALFIPLPSAYVVGIAVLALQAIVWRLRGQGLGLHRRAEEARRRALLMDALGEDGKALDVADIRAAMSKRACREAAQMDRSGYWASQADQGPSRLLSALQESAFWSRHLYEAAASRMYKIFTAVVLALVLIGLLGFVAFSGDTDLAVARVVVVALSALIGLDVLGQARAWQTAAKEAERIDRRLDMLDGTAIEPMLAVVADYAVATASAPPLPTSIYDAEKDRLEELWLEHRAVSP